MMRVRGCRVLGVEYDEREREKTMLYTFFNVARWNATMGVNVFGIDCFRVWRKEESVYKHRDTSRSLVCFLPFAGHNI